MDHPQQDRQPFDPERASTAELEAALLAWDELDDADLAALEADPRHGATLRRLQRAEEWLQAGGRGAAPEACPDAEALYDLGRGPGARPLPAERRAELERHTAGCAACRELLASLASHPPLPLFAGPDDEPAPLAEPAAPPARRPHRAWRVLRVAAPLAAAAAVVVLVSRPFGPTEAGPPQRLPAAPLLRGDDAGALLYPRGRAPWLARAGAWHGLPAGAAPGLELALPDGAEALRIELERHDGGAFGAGQALATLRFDPLADLPPEGPALPALEPGSYTWRAWARVNGLERELGARDFEVAADPALERALDELAPLAEPQRTEAAVRLLHEAGCVGAARRLARTLPPSPERDAYLERGPGR